MPTLYAEIDINAPQSVVWDALVRKDQWRFWNTFLYDCDPGLPMARGSEIFLSMQRLEGDEETEFQPLITMMRSPYVIRWVSTIPGLRSEHMFELRETVPGRTRYLHRETFSGILSKVFLPFIRQDERQGIRRMAQQLKMHVESNLLGNPPPRYGDDERSYRPDQGSNYRDQPYDQPNGRPSYERPNYERPYDDRSYGDRPYDDRGYNGPPHNGRNDYPRDDYPGDYKGRPRRR
ncbi:MAG: hypothetical protein WBA76_09690 [Phormidesmis sp.]